MTDGHTGITPSADALADLAEELAARAGALVMAMAVEARSRTATKSSATDLVTAADKAAEVAIVDGIDAVRPDDAIEGEEGTSRPGTTGVTWHVDPIDGTTNYVYNVPAFSVSIAAAIGDEVVAGAVFDPSLGRMYRAALGRGATVDGLPLRCTDKAELATALVATGFGYGADRRRRQAEALVELLPRIRDIRRFGSAALDLCAVAEGRVDAYYERGLNRWDLAAGALVAAEAGARVGNLDGGGADETFTLAAPPALFEPLAEVLRTAKA
ncbi:MAG: inositol monophosphatase family protein [Actinomycetota bacterium]